MIRYWDYSEKERAGLSREQVQSMLAVELMEKGVLLPGPAPAAPTGDPPALTTQTFYRVKRNPYADFGAVFRTAEAAAAFIALGPLGTDYDYQIGQKYVYPEEQDEFSVATIELYDKGAVKSQSSALKRVAAAQEAHKKALESHASTVKTADTATAKIWADWDRCQELGREHQRIVDTFGKYVTTADGDREIARKFLVKVFTEEQVKAAFAWKDISDPAITPADLTEPEDMPDPPLRMEVQKPTAWIDREPAVV